MIAAADGLVDVDLAGGDDGLEFVGNGDSSDKLSASIATDTVLGSVKIGDNVNVEPDGEISTLRPVIPVTPHQILKITSGLIRLPVKPMWDTKIQAMMNIGLPLLVLTVLTGKMAF